MSSFGFCIKVSREHLGEGLFCTFPQMTFIILPTCSASKVQFDCICWELGILIDSASLLNAISQLLSVLTASVDAVEKDPIDKHPGIEGHFLSAAISGLHIASPLDALSFLLRSGQSQDFGRI